MFLAMHDFFSSQYQSTTKKYKIILSNLLIFFLLNGNTFFYFFRLEVGKLGSSALSPLQFLGYIHRNLYSQILLWLRCRYLLLRILNVAVFQNDNLIQRSLRNLDSNYPILFLFFRILSRNYIDILLIKYMVYNLFHYPVALFFKYNMTQGSDLLKVSISFKDLHWINNSIFSLSYKF